MMAESAGNIVQSPMRGCRRRPSPMERVRLRLREVLINSGITVEHTELLLKEVPRKFEKYGDLLLLSVSAFQDDIWGGDDVGPQLWEILSSEFGVSRIGRQSVIQTDGFRTPRVEMLLGSDSVAYHTDNGVRYRWDVTKCMFSTGNITEKIRVASLDCRGEVVVDLYAGIGYFTLPYLVHSKADHVHACEWNPAAVDALRQNLVLNRVSDRCTVHEGDNRQVCPKGVADRVNLGLIPSSEEGWSVACQALKSSGGVLHIHHNVTTKSTLTSSPSQTRQGHWRAWADMTSSQISTLLCGVKGGVWGAEVVYCGKIKSYAPHIDHIVVDLECRPQAMPSEI